MRLVLCKSIIPRWSDLPELQMIHKPNTDLLELNTYESGIIKFLIFFERLADKIIDKFTIYSKFTIKNTGRKNMDSIVLQGTVH